MTGLTLNEWLNYHSTLEKLSRLLSKLKSSNLHVFNNVMRSQERYSAEELKAMVDFIGAEKLPPGFKLSKILHEIERVLEYE